MLMGGKASNKQATTINASLSESPKCVEDNHTQTYSQTVKHEERHTKNG
jgi:hypothetical protein